MAHGKNAEYNSFTHWYKDFNSRRPLKWFPVSKANKKICHRIERAQERRLILEEAKELVSMEGGFQCLRGG